MSDNEAAIKWYDEMFPKDVARDPAIIMAFMAGAASRDTESVNTILEFMEERLERARRDQMERDCAIIEVLGRGGPFLEAIRAAFAADER